MTRPEPSASTADARRTPWAQRRLAPVLTVAGAGLILLASYAAPLGWHPSAVLRGVLSLLGAALLLAGVLRLCLGEASHSAPRALQRRYLREFLPAMAGYALGVFVSMWLLKRIDPPLLRALVALLPIPGIVLAMRAMVRYIRDTDEMQRRIELEAICIATLCVSLGYLAAAFLQSAKVIAVAADAAMFWVFPLVCVAYGVAKVFVARRFR